jgi:hypothetical protein
MPHLPVSIIYIAFLIKLEEKGIAKLVGKHTLGSDKISYAGQNHFGWNITTMMKI